MAFMGITASRAVEIDFSPPAIQFDFTYLVPPGPSIFRIADADRNQDVIPALLGCQHRGMPMQTVQEYRQHAEECRRLAVRVGASEERDAIIEMAEAWEELADARQAMLRKWALLAA